MILLVGLLATVCATSAAPSRPIVVQDLPHVVPATVVAAPAAVVAAPVAVVSSQSHAQDELGQYSYSYSNPLSAKVETKTVDGITRGGYSYLDSHGLVQNVNYVSDDVNGFRVAASNLPLGRVTPQEDEPLVAHEKAKAVAALHQAAVHQAAEVVHENAVAPEPVYVDAPVAPVASVATAVLPAAPAPTATVVHPTAGPAAYFAEVRSTPAPPVYFQSSTLAPEIHVTPAPAVVAHAPVVHVTPPPAVVAHAPVVHVTPAPAVVAHAPVVHITPAPAVVAHAPSVAPEVHVTPAPYHPTPTSYSVPVEPAHSYAIVELDASDIPAPPPSPGAYLRPSYVAAAPSPTPIPVSTPAYEPLPVGVKVTEAILPAAPLAYDAPAPVAPVAPAPVEAHVVAAPAAVVAAPVAVVSSQSHAQDELGQYSYSYSNPLSAKVETKTVDGITRGGYSYLDSHGLVQNVNYVSDDHNGFRVAASNLPTAAVPVDIPDSQDVAAAKAVFFAEIAKAKAAAEHAH